MEAVGLAAGIVTFGLDLGTRLHTYVESVKGAGHRLSALAADVSATASIVRQLGDLLNEATVRDIFTAEGISDIEAVLRRCRHAYSVIVDVLLGVASSAASRTHTALTTAGLSELTAARLAKMSSRARWPWLEPRVKSCLTELRVVKLDLLLSLHVASLLKQRDTVATWSATRSDGQVGQTKLSKGKVEDDAEEVKGEKEVKEDDIIDETQALFTAAEALMSKRQNVNRHSSPSSSPSDDKESGSGSEKSSIPAKSSGSSTSSSRIIDHDSSSRTAPRQNKTLRHYQESPNLFAELIESLSIGTLTTAGREVEAWLVGYESPESLFTIPVRGPWVNSLVKTLRSHALVDYQTTSMLGQLVSLPSQLRTAVWDVMNRAQGKDARLRTLIGLLTPQMAKEVPKGVELLVLILTGDEEEVVYLEDANRQTWRMPFYALKKSLLRAEGANAAKSAVLRYWDNAAYHSVDDFLLQISESSHSAEQTQALGAEQVQSPAADVDRQVKTEVGQEINKDDAQAGEYISFSSLYDHLRPGLRVRLQKAPRLGLPALLAGGGRMRPAGGIPMPPGWLMAGGRRYGAAPPPPPGFGTKARDQTSSSEGDSDGEAQSGSSRKSSKQGTDSDLEDGNLFPSGNIESKTMALDNIHSIADLIARWSQKANDDGLVQGTT
ncbi:hypothetical protein LIA77_11014 [Sarocladium implicatum]|nr:hypothetical protein LIA77_11014 [Sarocladium implicatum]